MDDNTGIIKLCDKQAQAAAVLLARAFNNDPLFIYFFPDPISRFNKLTYFYKVLVNHGIYLGRAFTTPNLEGVAIWLLSDEADISVWGMLKFGALKALIRAGAGSISRILRFDKYASAVHKHNAPFDHVTLQPIGVEPKLQGLGFGSLLLKPQFERFDKESIPCYLDTQSEKNVSMYQYFGFKILEEFQIPGTNFKNWAMLREPIE